MVRLISSSTKERFSQHAVVSVSRKLILAMVVAVVPCAVYAQQPPAERKSKDELSANDLSSDSALAAFHIEFRSLRPMLQVARVLGEAHVAEAAGKLDVAAHKIAWAILATRTYAQRDTLERKLEQMVSKGAWGPIRPNQVAPRITQVLDSTFQVIYDRDFVVERAPVTSANPSGGQRVVLAEYITGIQCSVCWAHDRVYAALLQRYTPNQVVVIGYHDGPGFPIARASDSLWDYIGGNSKQGLYPSAVFGDTVVPYGDWVDGTPNGRLLEEVKRTREANYHHLREVIDRRRAVAPGAALALTLTPVQNQKKVLTTIRVTARVTPAEARRRLGVRFVLVQDTVRVTGYTPRRLQYMVARTISWFPGKKLFAPLPPESLAESTVSYSFDIAALQRELLQTLQRPTRTDDFFDQFRRDFPSQRDWILDNDRLGVVTIVQDQETLEVLQTVYQPLRTASIPAR